MVSTLHEILKFWQGLFLQKPTKMRPVGNTGGWIVCPRCACELDIYPISKDMEVPKEWPKCCDGYMINVSYQEYLAIRAQFPSRCPDCGSPLQRTQLTPPDKGVAIGCTKCPRPGSGD